jgi:zinc protease
MNQSATLKSLPGPEDITRVELPNGIAVLTRSNFESASVVISGYLPGGCLFDPLEKLGLAHYTAAALMRGTQARDFQEIFEALESSGTGRGSAALAGIALGGAAPAEFPGRTGGAPARADADRPGDARAGYCRPGRDGF